MNEGIMEWLRGNADRTELPRDAETLFHGWFGNHMAMLLMSVESVRPRKETALLRIQFFLQDVEHHYIRTNAPKQVRNAFRYLNRYFKVYPNVNRSHSERAVEMTARIYEDLGLVPRFKLLQEEAPISARAKNEIRRSVREVFGFCCLRQVSLGGSPI